MAVTTLGRIHEVKINILNLKKSSMLNKFYVTGPGKGKFNQQFF